MQTSETLRTYESDSYSTYESARGDGTGTASEVQVEGADRAAKVPYETQKPRRIVIRVRIRHDKG